LHDHREAAPALNTTVATRQRYRVDVTADHAAAP
jgi:hypothetical protein